MALRSTTPAAGALLGLAALVLPLTTPAAADARPDGRPPVVVAHRGASAYAPENTLAAVDEAAAREVTWVENDVQRTRDGALVVLHDTTLERTTDVEEVFPDRAPWRLADFTLAEVEKLDAGSWFAEDYAGIRIPTLRQYLRRVEANGQNLLLELKRPDLYPGIVRQTLRELAEEGWLDRSHRVERLIVQSFDADAVRTVHDRAPALTTGYLGTPKAAALGRYARFTDRINPRWSTVDAAYVRAVHALKGAHGRPLQVWTWTVDDAATARRMAERGVDGIISNRPDVVLEAVGDGAGPVLTGPTTDTSQ
ncbi:glycerophosphodiester phosphodiesterase [Streptomyces sp. TR06-5]|uniref:glycerophosphodiester phosphodiesterase n=1 Tax=unclassified Streptomyces TaxID=2593676 RepID=UPI0039A0B344